MKSTGNDFSGERMKPRRWRLWLVVLALHMLAASGLNAALSLNRLATTHSLGAMEVSILPPDLAVSEVRAAPKLAAKTIPRIMAKPPESQTIAEPEPESALAAVPEPIPLLAIATTPVVHPASLPASHIQHGLRASPPESILLKYNVQKDRDSAKASLSWRVGKPSAEGAASPYELTYEASYFGVSLIKQTSGGTLGAAGLIPIRFSDKRRGKSEQAAHFDAGKQRVTFSNNRPEAKLTVGWQDRASVLIQLSSLAAAQPNRFKTGDSLELPVASVDELEPWVFEVQGTLRLALPVGELLAVHLLRRPRRAFDQTIEVWLAPSLSHLPVRIRYTDSGGVTDSLLTSHEKL
ncbi:MAG: hypothetical protein RLY82_1732 [Pseudomonadota bacterium]